MEPITRSGRVTLLLSLALHLLIFALWLNDLEPPRVQLNAALAAEPKAAAANMPDTIQVRMSAAAVIPVTKQSSLPDPLPVRQPELQPVASSQSTSVKPETKSSSEPLRKSETTALEPTVEVAPPKRPQPIKQSTEEPSKAIADPSSERSAPEQPDTPVSVATLEEQLPQSRINTEQQRQNHKQQYLTYLSAVIAEQQRYPKKSRRKNEEGVISVRVTINPTGELQSVHIISNSRYNRLNRESLAMVRRAAPFRPLPQVLADQPLTVILPIQFSLRG